ncbi:hypothetical protein STEG23_010829 [Scotinomys teguina]
MLFAAEVIRRNPFGMDICCRKGSRSPLQELYNPIQFYDAQRKQAVSYFPLEFRGSFAKGEPLGSPCFDRHESR